jgi:hypothetical protein
MQTIEEATNEYVDNHMIIFPESAVKKAFKAGIHFTQKWFDINKEEPEYYQPILADNGKSMAVVARVSDGDEDCYTICGTDIIMNPDPIKWRPIELK